MSLFKRIAIYAIVAMAGVGMLGVAVPLAASAQVTPPVGFEKIPGPSSIKNFTDIIKFPGSVDLFGKPRSVAPQPVVVSQATTATEANESASVFGNTTLGNLLILSAVFNGNGVLGGNGLSGDNLGNLLILNDLFGNGEGTGISLTGTGNNSLGNLLILDALFGNNNNLFGGNLGGGSGLGNLIILNSLFNNSK